MKKLVPIGGITLAGVALFFASTFPVISGSADLNLQAQLVWGTNNEKPDDPKAYKGINIDEPVLEEI